MDLNESIALKVMEWKPFKDGDDVTISFIDEETERSYFFSDDEYNEWNPSNEISHAMEALEKARKKGILIYPIPTKEGYYIAYKDYYKGITSYGGITPLYSFFQLPKAICEVLLKLIDEYEVFMK